MKRPVLALLVIVIFACGAPEDTSHFDVWGDAFDEEGALPVRAVLAERAEYMGEPVKIEGTVSAVCKMMGCWLTLRSEGHESVRILVARDEEDNYKFTVPTDISGRHAVAWGTLSEEILTHDARQHLAEESDGVTPPERELRLTAWGVLVAKI